MSRLALRSLEREVLLWRRMWRGDAFTVFVQPVLFLAAMGLGLGGLVDEANGDIDGVSYLEFVAPGLLVVSAMMSNAGHALWGVMSGVKWMGHFQAMITTRMTPSDVLAGQVLASALRAGTAATAFILVGAALGAVTSWAAPVAIVAAMALAALTFVVLAGYSVTRESDETFSLIMRLGLVPLFLFSGTFFPVDRLPDGAEIVAALLPPWHAAELARMATTGRLSALALVHAAVLFGGIAVALPIASRNFTRRLTA